MNKEAKRLGCVDTNFVNAGGLHDNNHYTSAYDMYLIFNECLKHDEFAETIRHSSYKATYTDAGGERFTPRTLQQISIFWMPMTIRKVCAYWR